jgi:hypothetical protein
MSFQEKLLTNAISLNQKDAALHTLRAFVRSEALEAFRKWDNKEDKVRC